MPSIEIDSVNTLFMVWTHCRPSTITKGKTESYINELLDKARKTRKKSKAPNDKYIQKSNKLIEEAVIICNLYRMARTCPKKRKKEFDFKDE